MASPSDLESLQFKGRAGVWQQRDQRTIFSKISSITSVAKNPPSPVKDLRFPPHSEVGLEPCFYLYLSFAAFLRMGIVLTFILHSCWVGYQNCGNVMVDSLVVFNFV